MTGPKVVIAGRAFTIGAIYAPRQGRGGHYRPRRLLSHDESSILYGGRVRVALVPSGIRRTMTGAAWAAWAGEEIEA